MIDFKTEYEQRSDEELLQLWVERRQLAAEAKGVLQEEILRRSLTADAERATDVWAEPPERKLAPPVNTYCGISVLWFWVRELWLRFQTKDGLPVQAKVESTRQTRRPSRGSARAELRYSYTYGGQTFLGRTVRDFTFSKRAADALAFDHEPGNTITVHIDREHPGRSYFPSGFGWLGMVDVLISGGIGLFVLFFWVSIVWYRLHTR